MSEIYPNRPAAASGQVFVGDAILSVNNIDLRNLKHEEAVDILNQQKNQVKLKITLWRVEWNKMIQILDVLEVMWLKTV